MPWFEFDLEDGKSPVGFSLKPADAPRFMRFMAECQALKVAQSEDQTSRLREVDHALAAVIDLRPLAEATPDGADHGQLARRRRALREAEQALLGLRRGLLGTEAPTHTTQPGESVAGIALRQLGSEHRWREIAELNADRFPGMLAPDYYPAGTVLKMPTAAARPGSSPDEQETLQSGDSLAGGGRA